MPALALTDLHGLTGAVAFYTACQAAGVQPILGCELPVQHPAGLGSLVLLAENMTGWGSLCRLSSVLQMAPDRRPEAGLAWETLAGGAEGLVCLVGSQPSPLQALLEGGENAAASAYLARLTEIFPERLYVSLEFAPASGSRTTQHAALEALTRLAAAQRVPTVASNNVTFIRPEEHRLHVLLTAMRTLRRMSEISAEDVVTPAAYFMSPGEMGARFTAFPGAVERTLEVAARCKLDLPLGVPHYPELPLPDGVTAAQVLRQKALAGAQQLYRKITPEIHNRLEHELGVIEARNYAPLFLIMAEILEFARRDGVPTASRGSASSSLVAHCLGITTPDPLALNLYFERFLNPARSTPPDIDTDLCSARRGRVIEHVYTQYGRERVAMVATINRLRGRSALREVAKAYGLTTAETNQLTTALPYRGWRPGSPGEEEDLPYADLAAQFPQHKALFQDAAALLEYPRHLSIHPGGVVIAPGVLTDLVPLHLASKGIVITQFDLDAIQQLGLVKIDLLGTRGLSVLGDVAEKVYTWNQTTFTNPLAVLDAIPQADPAASALVRSAQTIGCFQIESPGMRQTLREIQASSPADLLIALALYRPGPMTGGLKDAFIRRHLGQEPVHHLHPALAPLLGDTYGVILYQEQVLRIASGLSGLSLADADLLRRAMSHFDPGEKMKTLKARFIEGAGQKSGVPAQTAEQIWELMAAFAGYGFPKAHAASYAQVAWRAAWCKAHYPAEFMAAVLANWGGFYSQRVYLNEARRMGLRLRPPHVNHARGEFRVAYPGGEPVLYMGLNQVRELTQRTQQRIQACRPFHSLEDFLTRVDPRPGEAANLVLVGALDGLGDPGDMLLRVRQGGWQFQQLSLFEAATASAPAPGQPWSLAERVAAQMDILGAAVDAHPLELIPAPTLARLGALSTAAALEKPGQRVRVLGIRQTLQRFFYQGEPSYILELEDLSSVLPVSLAPDQRRRYAALLDRRQPLVVEGEMEMSALGEPVLRARRMWGVEEHG